MNVLLGLASDEAENLEYSTLLSGTCYSYYVYYFSLPPLLRTTTTLNIDDQGMLPTGPVGFISSSTYTLQ